MFVRANEVLGRVPNGHHKVYYTTCEATVRVPALIGEFSFGECGLENVLCSEKFEKCNLGISSNETNRVLGQFV